jgi:DNA polymerase I-like protein with 3'-5' exonuclease and polymerase domains
MGFPSLDEETLEAQELIHPEKPEIRLFRELKATLDQMKVSDLAVGSDGRHRAPFHPYRTVTGRNAPTNFIFGAAKWMRGLMKPPPGCGLAYSDFCAQEVAIAAALSHDARLAEHYQSDDIYWRFAIRAGLDSRGDRKTVRALVKILFLAIGYGMGAPALAAKAGISVAEARELLALHAATYPDFTRWRAHIVDAAYLHGWLKTSFGWRRLGCADVSHRQKSKTGIIDPKDELRRWGRGVTYTELMNWPVQSAGAEMMRIVCIAATEAGVDLLAPIHDGFLYMAPIDRLEHDIARMEDLMRRSSCAVTGGLAVKVETASVRYPERYMDAKGSAMWARIMALYEARIRRATAS